MNELNLYHLFEQILSKSKVIEGRFHVSKTNTAKELNTSNLEEITIDAFGAIKTNRKYPIAILLPPTEILDNYADDEDYTPYQLRMLFLTQTYNGSNGIKSPNFMNNTSQHPVRYDWKDMRECARNFRKAFIAVTENQKKEKYILDGQGEDFIQRLSNIGNDKLSGVIISFKVLLFEPCKLTDYDPDDLENITIEKTDIHPLHKH
jgi:hypothetical protein